MNEQRSDVVEKQKQIDAMPDGETKEAMQGCLNSIKEIDNVQSEYERQTGKSEPMSL